MITGTPQNRIRRIIQINNVWRLHADTSSQVLESFMNLSKISQCFISRYWIRPSSDAKSIFLKVFYDRSIALSWLSCPSVKNAKAQYGIPYAHCQCYANRLSKARFGSWGEEDWISPVKKYGWWETQRLDSVNIALSLLHWTCRLGISTNLQTQHLN